MPADEPQAAKGPLIPKESVDEIVEQLQQAGLDNLQAILRASDKGQITPEVRDALLEDLVDDLGEAVRLALDVVTPFLSPIEELTDLAIEEGVEALEPLLQKGLEKLGGAVHELFDRDAWRLQRRIERKERQLAEADTKRESNRKQRQLDRLVTLYVRHFSEDAHRDGWRLNLDGQPIRVKR